MISFGIVQSVPIYLENNIATVSGVRDKDSLFYEDCIPSIK